MHFTYQEGPLDRLQQGDIISRTAEIEEMLKEVHPHYANANKYRFFIVLTQSCDLVQRGGANCAAKYISIAAVRPLHEAIMRFVDGLFQTSIERKLRFCSAERQVKLSQFVERLFNNNEPGLFYLRKEPSKSFNEDHCAVLALSIALRADLHYSKLLDARVISLTQAFQHKLGYWAGHQYSRIATDDWTPEHYPERDFRGMVESIAKDEKFALWVEKGIHKKVLKALDAQAQPTIEDLKQAITSEKDSGHTRKRQVVDVLNEVLSEQDLKVSDEQKTKILRRLQNKPAFNATFP